MKNNIFKLIFLLLVTAFSIIWVSDKLSVIIENEKYSFYGITENSDPENQTENKLKTPFIDQIELLHFSIFLPLSVKRNNSFYLFNIKEFLFENITPPPEVV